MKKIALVCFALLTVGATGCGSGKSSDVAKIMNKQANSTSLMAARYAYSQAQGQAYLQAFAAEAGQTETIPGCNITTSASSVTLACTTTADADFASCGDDTYKMLSGSKFNVSLDMSNTALYKFGFGIDAKFTGGSLESTEVKCDWNFTFDVAKLQAGDPEGITVDCGNAANKCTVDGDEVACEDMKDEQLDSDNACAAT
jgi:hypothetical protein